MGASNSVCQQRAAKFSGSTKRRDVPPLRRTASNTTRNVKEFSAFWTRGGSFRPSPRLTCKHTPKRTRAASLRRRKTESPDSSPSPRTPCPSVIPGSPITAREVIPQSCTTSTSDDGYELSPCSCHQAPTSLPPLSPNGSYNNNSLSSRPSPTPSFRSNSRPSSSPVTSLRMQPISTSPITASNFSKHGNLYRVNQETAIY